MSLPQNHIKYKGTSEMSICKKTCFLCKQEYSYPTPFERFKLPNGHVVELTDGVWEWIDSEWILVDTCTACREALILQYAERIQVRHIRRGKKEQENNPAEQKKSDGST